MAVAPRPVMRYFLPGILFAVAGLSACQPADGGDDSSWYAPVEDEKADGQWTGPKLFASYATRFEIRIRGVSTKEHPECATPKVIKEGDACWTYSNADYGAVVSGLGSVSQSGGTANLSTGVCSLRNTRYVNAKVDAKAYPNLAPTSFKLTLEPKGDGEKATFSVASSDGLFIYGVKKELFQDAVNDPLPWDKKDPRVDDPDKDGNPGLTFSDKINVYMATRAVTAMHGESDADGAIKGTYRTSTVKMEFVGYGDGIWGIDPSIGAIRDVAKEYRTLELTTVSSLVPLKKDAPSCTDAMAALPLLNLLPPK